MALTRELNVLPLPQQLHSQQQKQAKLILCICTHLVRVLPTYNHYMYVFLFEDSVKIIIQNAFFGINGHQSVD